VTLIKGDCLEVIRRLAADGILCDAVITDPPYCSGAATEAARGAATHQGLRRCTIRSGRFAWFGGDNMTTGGLIWLLRQMVVAVEPMLSVTGSILVFCDWRMALMLGPALESAGFRLRNLVIWDKGSFGCGTGFRPRHEMILHLTKRAPVFYATDVANVIPAKRVRSSLRSHPTQKPLELLRSLIRVVTPPNGTVLDPFAGSGSTGIAAAAEGRKAILIEKA
jgi:DNA modification methylase